LEGLVFHAPFGYLDYNKLQAGAFCVVSDSGTISEESAIIGFPAVSIRDSIERPEALETGSMILTGLSPENLIHCVTLVTSKVATSSMPSGYEVEDFSERVLRFVSSTARLHASWANIRC
jgi:UDP-N-acetylglucosamine 2-epimerase (non-hydrolysing)